MTAFSHCEAARLKLHLLSEGISFDSGLVEHVSGDLASMEKRRAYNDSDERQLDRAQRIPQELYLQDVIVAINYKQHSPWRLVYREGSSRLIGREGVDVELTFPRRPRFFERVPPNGLRCDSVANLYGGSSLPFFTPATSSHSNNHPQCLFSSLQPNP